VKNKKIITKNKIYLKTDENTNFTNNKKLRKKGEEYSPLNKKDK
jgi:hypothetical protein